MLANKQKRTYKASPNPLTPGLVSVADSLHAGILDACSLE